MDPTVQQGCNSYRAAGVSSSMHPPPPCCCCCRRVRRVCRLWTACCCAGTARSWRGEGARERGGMQKTACTPPPLLQVRRLRVSACEPLDHRQPPPCQCQYCVRAPPLAHRRECPGEECGHGCGAESSSRRRRSRRRRRWGRSRRVLACVDDTGQ